MHSPCRCQRYCASSVTVPMAAVYGGVRRYAVLRIYTLIGWLLNCRPTTRFGYGSLLDSDGLGFCNVQSVSHIAIEPRKPHVAFVRDMVDRRNWCFFLCLISYSPNPNSSAHNLNDAQITYSYSCLPSST